MTLSLPTNQTNGHITPLGLNETDLHRSKIHPAGSPRYAHLDTSLSLSCGSGLVVVAVR